MATIYVDENLIQHPMGSIVDSLPIGSIVLWPSNTIPKGYKVCNGSSVSKTDYPDLFKVLEYTYGGSGDSFNLPDYSGRTPVGVNSTFTLASTGGEVNHTLTIDEIPSHSHTFHSNLVFAGSGSDGTGLKQGTDARPSTTIDSIGGGQSHNNMQPYIVQNYIIKVLYSAAGTGGGGGDASSDIIIIGDESEVTEDTKLLVEPEEIDNLGTEVVNSLEGNQTTMAPSVYSVKQALDSMKNIYSTTEGIIVGYLEDGTPIYRKVLTGTKTVNNNLVLSINDNVKEILSVPEARIMTNGGSGGYVIPFYESNTVFVRVEINNNGNVTIKSGSSSEYGQGTIRLAVLYTKTTDAFIVGTNYSGKTMNMSFPNNTTFTDALYSLGGGEQGENSIVTFGDSAIAVGVDVAAGTAYYDLKFYPDINDLTSYTTLYRATYTISTETWNYITNLSSFTFPSGMSDCSNVKANISGITQYITIS